MARVRSAAPWVVVTAAIAAVVCLAAWPRPTLYALGAVAGAIALLVGLRLLTTERGQTSRPPCAGCAGGGGPDCAERPDGSGPDPETARTNPDAPGQQPADQPGHDPDDLRTRIADAIRTALKTRTLPAITDYAGRPITSTAIGLTEYDIADVALTVVQPELDTLAAANSRAQEWETRCLAFDQARAAAVRNRWAAARRYEITDRANLNALAECDAIDTIEAESQLPPGKDDIRRVIARIRRALTSTPHAHQQLYEGRWSVDVQEPDESVVIDGVKYRDAATARMKGARVNDAPGREA